MNRITRFVLDASIALSWGLEDESSPYADAVLDALEQTEAIVPEIWPLEVGNALLVAHRRKRINFADIIQFLSFLQKLPIFVEPADPVRIFGEVLILAREHRLSVYDAAYLDLALQRGLALATEDEALRTAAGRAGVVLFQEPKRN